MKNEREKDDFWDLASLLPKRSPAAPLSRFASSTAPAEVSAPPRGEGDARRDEERRLTGASVREGAREEYRPDGNSLILSVALVRRTSDYNFYGQFRRDAIRLLEAEGSPCERAPFFSYIPQYTQLTAAQRAYYLYWRSELRRGNYLSCDESYFYLYAYEIINLPDYIPPKKGIELLCTLWSAYRKSFPRVDKYMVEWVTDYCLVHALPCPAEQVRPFLRDILSLATLKEFYLGAFGDLSRKGIETALAFFCDYRFRESRYATGEHAALFETHIFGAITPVLAELLQDGRLMRENSTRSLVTREAFCGSLCAHNVKCRIEVSYLALADVAAFRLSVTAAVKYAENKLRALLAVKSRLSVPPLAPHYREMIDAYFAAAQSSIVPAPKKDLPPAYEKLYDAPSRGVDPEAAREIELRSWATTRILVTDEELAEAERTEAPPVPIAAPTPVPAPAAEEGSYPYGITEREAAYLRACIAGDRAAVRAELSALHMLEEELAAALNDKTVTEYGDIILEPTEYGYAVIPDYEEEVTQWIQIPK